MRLLDTTTLRLRTFHEPRLPEYAILSHTWISDEDEVSLQELRSLNDNALSCQCGKDSRDERTREKEGYAKIVSFCRLAKQDGFDFAWVDTCCIDKANSTELSEAINSMYRWYRTSKTCYVYLADVPPVDRLADEPFSLFKGSRWFKRGWTLQEMLASQRLKYFARDWNLIGVTVRGNHSNQLFSVPVENCQCTVIFPGTRCVEPEVAEASGIRLEHLSTFDPQSTGSDYVSVAERMSWAANRETTRLEDVAYSLLGIFNIDMPLMYGEGQKAFMRLQEEIIKHSVDKTILAWDRNDLYINLIKHSGDNQNGTWDHDDYSIDQLLAPSPQYFRFTDFAVTTRFDQFEEVHQISSQALVTHLDVADHPKCKDTLVARLDDAHSLLPFLLPSETRAHQTLLVLSTASRRRANEAWWWDWVDWILSTQDADTYQPQELALSDLAKLQGRPWAFRRRRLCIIRWRTEPRRRRQGDREPLHVPKSPVWSNLLVLTLMSYTLFLYLAAYYWLPSFLAVCSSYLMIVKVRRQRRHLYAGEMAELTDRVKIAPYLRITLGVPVLLGVTGLIVAGPKGSPPRWHGRTPLWIEVSFLAMFSFNVSPLVWTIVHRFRLRGTLNGIEIHSQCLPNASRRAVKEQRASEPLPPLPNQVLPMWHIRTDKLKSLSRMKGKFSAGATT